MIVDRVLLCGVFDGYWWVSTRRELYSKRSHDREWIIYNHISKEEIEIICSIKNWDLLWVKGSS